MNQEKLVIFDWGGVIESHRNGEYNVYCAVIDIIHRLSPNDIDDQEIIRKWQNCAIDEKGNNIGIYSDMVNTKKWFERIKKEFNLTCNVDEFFKIYYEQGSKIKYYSKVVEFAHHLKSKCKVGILSNLMLLDRKRIDSQVMLDKFDYIWLSFEMGCKKPSNEIYQKVEEKCKINPEQILFIDDTLENILAAKKRGWQTIKATGYEFEKIKEGVRKFLDE